MNSEFHLLHFHNLLFNLVLDLFSLPSLFFFLFTLFFSFSSLFFTLDIANQFTLNCRALGQLLVALFQNIVGQYINGMRVQQVVVTRRFHRQFKQGFPLVGVEFLFAGS